MSDLRSTVFVGNLSVFVTEHDLEHLFSAYGTILEIRMAKSEDRSKHLSYGFVKFANVASAQLAMHELNGSLLCGRPLKVGKAFSRSNKKIIGSVPTGPQSYDTASVHVTFISHQIIRIVNEESLRHLFSQFGEVVDAVICKSSIDQVDVGRQSGYGFIHYPGNSEGIESSFRAAETLMDIMIDEVNYKCKISHHLERQLLEVAGDITEQPAAVVAPRYSSQLATSPNTVPVTASVNYGSVGVPQAMYSHMPETEVAYSVQPTMQMYQPSMPYVTTSMPPRPPTYSMPYLQQQNVRPTAIAGNPYLAHYGGYTRQEMQSIPQRRVVPVSYMDPNASRNYNGNYYNPYPPEVYSSYYEMGVSGPPSSSPLVPLYAAQSHRVTNISDSELPSYTGPSGIPVAASPGIDRASQLRSSPSSHSSNESQSNGASKVDEQHLVNSFQNFHIDSNANDSNADEQFN